MTNLEIRNNLILDLELFLIKGPSRKENETCFLYRGVSYTREPTVGLLSKRKRCCLKSLDVIGRCFLSHSGRHVVKFS